MAMVVMGERPSKAADVRLFESAFLNLRRR